MAKKTQRTFRVTAISTRRDGSIALTDGCRTVIIRRPDDCGSHARVYPGIALAAEMGPDVRGHTATVEEIFAVGNSYTF